MMQRMVIQMDDGQLQTLAQLPAFLNGTTAVDFAVAAEERYGFIGRTVRRFTYKRLKRAQKAVVLRFLDPPQDSCKNIPQLVDVSIRTRAYDQHPHAPAHYFSD